MKFTPPLWFGLLLVFIAASAAVGQTSIKARTETGKDVILLADGTWKYVIEDTPPSTAVANKPAGSASIFKAPNGGFGIWYDDSKWIMEPKSEHGTAEFKLKRGDAYVIVLIEELNVPLATLREVALENAKAAAPDVKVIFEETRTVNKKDVLCMKFEGTVKGISLTYYGYYYGGKQGSIQLLTFTGRDLFQKYEKDMTDFLNGLEIY